jgi:hypothetical protein
MFRQIRRLVAGSYMALLRARYLLQAQPHSLLSGPEKRAEIKKWQRITGCRLFVETGTFRGDTTLAMADVFDRCWTIEIDRVLYERAIERFAGRDNITAIHGDSETRMAGILNEIASPTIFWLDGHYSGGSTGRGVRDSPILNELKLIFEHPIKEHVILIDDARQFLGIDGYPTIKELQRFVRAHSPYRVRVTDDIIKLYNEPI